MNNTCRMTATMCLSVLTIALAGFPGTGSAIDRYGPSAEEMKQQLRREPEPAPTGVVTRSLFGAGTQTRGINVEDAPAAVPRKASVDMSVEFEFNSATLTTDAMITLDRLGSVLTDPEFASSNFQIAGHTDAVGSETYNQKLSEMRAAAVRQYLIQRFSMDESHLASMGLGKSQPLEGKDPFDPINRRVEVVNLGP